MRRSWLLFAGLMMAVCVPSIVAASKAGDSAEPVFVELFTSEGCSSCPPADALLGQIAQQQPDAIVLSEHVTYWNHDGWRDPFSSEESTARQAAYVSKMGLGSSYTPQMVVNGQYEFVGSDGRAAAQAIKQAALGDRVAVHLSDVVRSADHRVHFNVEVAAVKTDAVLVAVMAQDEGVQHVSNGENGGRTLRHVRIARSLQQVAKIAKGSGYHGSPSINLPEPIAGSGWHLVVFLQQGSGGPIVGAASQAI